VNITSSTNTPAGFAAPAAPARFRDPLCYAPVASASRAMARARALKMTP
jgi:hypothetical protein